MKLATVCIAVVLVVAGVAVETEGASLYLAYTNGTEVVVGMVDAKTGVVTAMCSGAEPAGTWAAIGAYSTELAYIGESSGDLVLVDIDQMSCTTTTTPVTGAMGGVLLVSEPANGGGDGNYAGVSFPNITFGSIDLSSGEIDSVYPTNILTEQTGGIEASLFDTVNNVFVVATTTSMFKVSYVVREYPLPLNTFVNSLAFNWRNNGYVAVVTEGNDAPYVASVSLGSPVSFTKIAALPASVTGGCLETATYDIPAGRMYLLCGTGTDNVIELVAVALDGSAPATSTPLSTPPTTSYQFIVSA